MLLLNVPYSEKDEAKALGAYWNPTLKRWYVKDQSCYHRFARWILPYGDTIVCDRLYIVEGCQKCFKCGRETRVIGYGLEHFMELEDDGDNISYDWNDEEIRITEINNEYVPVLSPVISYLQTHYNYKKRYSQTTYKTTYNSCCDHCNVLQGRYYIFHEVDSPFFITSEKMARGLRLYMIPLEYDIIISANPGFGSNDYLIKEYATIRKLDIALEY